MRFITVNLRAVARLFGVAALLLGGVLVVAGGFPWLAYARRAALKQAWSRWLLRALGVVLPDAPAVREQLMGGEARWGLVVANHVSFLDVFVINAAMPLGFVAKREVADWPLIGWLTARTDNLFIERGQRRAAHLTQARMAGQLAAGRNLALFPEGTTTRGDRVLPFHSALLESAIVAQVPVICLALAYEDATGAPTARPAYAGDDSLADCLWRIVSSPAVVARLEVAACLSSADGERRHLAHRAHQCIARSLASGNGVAERKLQ